MTRLSSRTRIVALASLIGATTAVSAQDQPREARVLRGEAVLSALTGGRSQPAYEQMRRDFPFLADATAAYALGDVWGRPGLDTRTRQLAACAAFASLGMRAFFKIHAGYALDHGVTPDELKEIVYLVTVPGGFPRAIEASQALQEVLVEKGRSGVSK